MDVFHSLPTEILTEIFSNLSHTDLLHTSYLSHRLRALSQPLLYSAPSLYTFGDSSFSHPTSAIENLLHTLHTPPGAALANYVHSLFLRWGRRSTNDRESDHPHRFLTDTANLGPAPTYLALRGLVPNSQVLLLLARLPRLQVLHLELNHITAHSFNSFVAELTSTLGASSSPPSAFHSLRSVTYSPRITASGLSYSSLLTLLLLPSIDILEISLHVSDDLPATYGVGCTSTVTDLCLWNNGILATELRSILSIPRRLRRFACHSPMDAPFAHAMGPLRDSLTHLELVPHSTVPTVYPVGSLRAWTGLQSLRCSLTHLADTTEGVVDAMPRGIRTLEVLLDPYDASLPRKHMRTLVEEVLGRKEEVVPCLKKLVLDVDPGSEREEVLAACVRAGVAFWSQVYAADGCCYEVPV